MEVETEDMKPLLARIQSLKSANGGALSGTQLMAFFLQRRIQPLQHRISKVISYLVTRVNSTNVLDEGLRIGGRGSQMNSKVKSIK
jgi:hypothetical protein